MSASTALSLAKQYLSQIAVGEWRWESNCLIAPDGTVILWAVSDRYGKKYVGVQADYEYFIARSSLIVKALVEEIEAKPR